MVQASLRQRVLCHGRAVAACWFRQEAACLPVRSPQAPDWPSSHTLSSLAALPMQHHNSQASSLSAAMTCQPRLPFAAQVGPAAPALTAHHMQCKPGCHFGGNKRLLGQHSDATHRRIRAPCECLMCPPVGAVLHSSNISPVSHHCTIITIAAGSQTYVHSHHP